MASLFLADRDQMSSESQATLSPLASTPPISPHHLEFSKILSLYGLDADEDVLDTKVSHIDSQTIATACSFKWGQLLPLLGVKHPKTVQNDIQNDYSSLPEKRENFFSVWIKEKGSEATYRALIIALLQIKERESAEFVCNLLKEQCDSNSLQGIYLHS